MSFLLRGLFLSYIIIKLIVSKEVAFAEVVLVLLIVAGNVYREKFDSDIKLVLVETAVLAYATYINQDFALLFGLNAYDLAYKSFYIGIAGIVGIGVYLLGLQELIIFLLVLSLCIYFAYVKSSLEEKEELYRRSYDKERQYRYELEQTKQKLINSSKEVTHITEVKERNRIARDIHDNVGHSIAGILMQLQATQKLRGRDDAKSDELLKSSIEGLANTLVVLRETVHNLKPRESLGVEYIKVVIESFMYCPVDFSHSGNFDILSPDHIEIIHTNIKEALTNVSKYSKASKAEVKLDIYDKFARLYIRDNGIGCTHIKEGLGLSGMKERISNIGGSISISSYNGFLIVCILPIVK